MMRRTHAATSLGLLLGLFATAAHAQPPRSARAKPLFNICPSPQTSTTTLTSSVNPSVFGQSTTLTATVVTVGPAAPLGQVTFFDGATTLGTGVVNGLTNVATFTWSTASTGTHASVTASYGGTLCVGGSTSSALTQVVNQAGTTTSLKESSDPSNFGDSVTFTATVAVTSPGAGTPTGTVTFVDTNSGTTLGSGTVAGNGQATLTTSSLAPGSYDVTATYGGDTNFTGSSSSGQSEVVNQEGTSLVVGTSQSPAVFQTSVTFTATVTSNNGGTPTGTVSFLDGATPIGSGTLSGGVATLTTAALAVGTHTITANYGGDTDYDTSTNTVAQEIDVAPTTTAVLADVNPSVAGQTVTFTATVAGNVAGGVVPTGSVTYSIDGSPGPTATLDGNGNATFSTAALTTGSHTITAAYGGDGNFAGSDSSASPLTQVVNQAATATALISSSNPSNTGDSVTFTATVTAVAPGSGTPTGTVTFTEGVTTLGSGTLDGNGNATFATSALAAGSHDIVATYGGDGDFTGSSSTTLTQSVQDGATTALGSSENPSTFGDSVTFTATVTDNSGGATPTGTIEFDSDGVQIGSGTLDGSGVATFTTTTLPGGSHTISAIYSGDGTHASATGSLVQVVNAASSSTALGSSANPSVFDQSITLTATVTSMAGGTPTGTVTFTEGRTTLGTVTLDNTGAAALPIATLAVGTHSITAVYSGDSSYGGSTSTTLSQVVNQAATTSTVSSSTNPSLAGAGVTFTAIVAPVAPGGGIATGTVTFFDGTTTLGTAALRLGGTAAFTTSTLAPGTHAITVSYGGSADYTGSTSSVLTQTVTATAATITVTADVNPSAYGAPVTFTVTVGGSGGRGTPTGTISFQDGTTTLGSATLDGNGIATLTTKALTGGTHTITAAYSGDGVYGAGTGTVTQVVTTAATMTALASSKNPAVAGDSVTFTATVTSSLAGFGGQVQFLDGTTVLGTATLSGGKATFATLTLAVGSHVITAVYSGDANFAGSTSMPLTESITAAPVVVGDMATGKHDAGPNGIYLSGGGCNCRMAPATEASGPFILAILALVLVATRRRRS
jgi:MYXO-CTERM domain-containing protein